MKLVLPNYRYKNQYIDLVKSAKKNNDVSEMGNAYRENESFNHMLVRLKDRRNGKNLSKKDVKSIVYFIIVDNKLVGTIDARQTLNDSYFSRLGHIAYYIKPEERNKGFATKALSLALKKYQKNKIYNILITCFKDNIASKKVIEKNKGIFEKEFYDRITNKIVQRYWINTSPESKVVPKTIWLTTNRTCNNDCKWCYSNSCIFKNDLMNLTNIYNCIDFISKNQIKKVILIGGEPTIYDGIDKVIKKLNENGIKVSMASNGRKFSDYNFAKKLVNCGLNSCNISIKGADENEYIKNTNSYGFNEMIKGYNNLKKLGINVSLSYVICDKDFNKFDYFLDSFIKNKLDNIIFQLYKPSVDGEENYNAPTLFDIADMCKYVYKKMLETKINFKFEMSIPLCLFDETLLNDMISKRKITTCCHISKGNGLIFDSNFDILPCNHFVNHPLNKEKIEFDNVINFWNSKDVKEFRKIINTYPSEICSRCSKWNICGGGCFIRWLSLNPTDVINDKYTYYRKEVIK